MYVDGIALHSLGLDTKLINKAIEAAHQLGAIRIVIGFTHKNASNGKLHRGLVGRAAHCPLIEF